MDTTTSLPLVSIVMINWNRKEILRHVLTTLAGQSYPNYEIVLCDNNSSDGAPDMVESEFPDVQLIRSPENVGITGYNIAFERSRGEIIVILDNDSFLEDDGIAAIVKKFQAYPALGALGCKVYNYYSGRIHHWHPWVTSDHVPEEGVDAPLFNGCAAAARSSVLKEVGFYADEFFLYENERDLCTRIISAGYAVKYFTDISGYHMVSEEGRSSNRLIYYSTRNLIWYYWKFIPIRSALLRTAVIAVSSTLSALTSGKVRMHLKPVLDALLALPRIMKKRTPVQAELLAKVLY
ncbi:MAG: glycosyltransferase family 2 protein [Desulfobacteraceae bacterium]|nr:glycosyltransferase family 2 protein [Desulfobacteraceae bacterium]